MAPLAVQGAAAQDATTERLAPSTPGPLRYIKGDALEGRQIWLVCKTNPETQPNPLLKPTVQNFFLKEA
jgi:hypothetical protein